MDEKISVQFTEKYLETNGLSIYLESFMVSRAEVLRGGGGAPQNSNIFIVSLHSFFFLRTQRNYLEFYENPMNMKYKNQSYFLNIISSHIIFLSFKSSLEFKSWLHPILVFFFFSSPLEFNFGPRSFTKKCSSNNSISRHFFRRKGKWKWVHTISVLGFLLLMRPNF